MRKLLCAACGYAAALLLIHYLLPLSWAPWAALACALPGLAALLLRKERLRLAAAISLLAAALGFVWYFGYQAWFVAPAEAFADETRTVTVRVSDFSRTYDDYASVRVRCVDDTLPHVSMLVYDYDGDLHDLRPGDVVDMPLKLLSAGQYYREESDHYFSEGILLRGYLKGDYAVTGRWGGAWLYFPRHIARAIFDQVERCFPADVTPLMTALLSGDRTLLYADDGLYTALRTAGFIHFIAVSGMHVAFVVGVLGLLVGRRRRVAFVAIPVIVVFMAMVGFTPSVVRAGVMQILLLVAPLLQRETDPLTSLSAAALVILLPNPIAVASVSFQLSFAAMTGLILLTPRIYDWLVYDAKGASRLPRSLWGRLLRSVCSVFSASVGAVVFTTPISALYFGFVPVYAVLTNLLCLWAGSAAFLLGYPVCLLGLIWKPLGVGSGWLVAWLPRYIAFAVQHIARLPGAVLLTRGTLGAWWLVFAYAVFIAAYLCRGKGRFRPVLPLCISVFTLLLLFWFPARQLTGRLELSAVDVGQGQSLVALTEYGTVVIDCGGVNSQGNAGDAAANCLRSYGREQIDLLVLTHFHADHANGVQRLMRQIPVKRLAYPTDCEENEYLTEILDCCRETGTVLCPVSENTVITVDSLDLRIYAPLGSEDVNEHCLLLRGSCGDFDFLVTGDAGSGVEKLLTGFYDLGDMELLVVGHHGSRYSTCDTLLDDITPEAAIISVGAGNRYGHPTEDVLERLRTRGIEIYRTDLDGTVTITAGDDNGKKG